MTNELVTTILTFGEGLHNNHHGFPRDAYLSHAWYEIDINGLIILGSANSDWCTTFSRRFAPHPALGPSPTRPRSTASPKTSARPA